MSGWAGRQAGEAALDGIVRKGVWRRRQRGPARSGTWLPHLHPRWVLNPRQCDGRVWVRGSRCGLTASASWWLWAVTFARAPRFSPRRCVRAARAECFPPRGRFVSDKTPGDEALVNSFAPGRVSLRMTDAPVSSQVAASLSPC